MKYQIPITVEVFECRECEFKDKKDFRIERDGIKYCPECNRMAYYCSLDKNSENWQDFSGIVKIRKEEEHKLRNYLTDNLIKFLETGKINNKAKTIYLNPMGLRELRRVSEEIYTLTDACEWIKRLINLLIEKRDKEILTTLAEERGLTFITKEEKTILKEVSENEFKKWKKQKEKDGFKVYFFRTMLAIEKSDLPDKIKKTCKKEMRIELTAVEKEKAGVIVVIPPRTAEEKLFCPGSVIPHPDYDMHGNFRGGSGFGSGGITQH